MHEQYDTSFPPCLQTSLTRFRAHRPHQALGNLCEWPRLERTLKISSREDKYHWYYAFVGSSCAAFKTADHEQNPIRRRELQAYFTSETVAHFDPVYTNSPLNSALVWKSLKSQTKWSIFLIPSDHWRRIYLASFALIKVMIYLIAGFCGQFPKSSGRFPRDWSLASRLWGCVECFEAMLRRLAGVVHPSELDVLDCFSVSCLYFQLYSIAWPIWVGNCEKLRCHRCCSWREGCSEWW